MIDEGDVTALLNQCRNGGLTLSPIEAYFFADVGLELDWRRTLFWSSLCAKINKVNGIMKAIMNKVGDNYRTSRDLISVLTFSSMSMIAGVNNGWARKSLSVFQSSRVGRKRRHFARLIRRDGREMLPRRHGRNTFVDQVSRCYRRRSWYMGFYLNSVIWTISCLSEGLSVRRCIFGTFVSLHFVSRVYEPVPLK